MKYLHASDIDTSTHGDLNGVIGDIQTQGSINNYASVVRSPVREQDLCIPIINSTIEGYLTTSEQSGLVDTDSYTTTRNGDIPTPTNWAKILIRCCEQWGDSDLNLPHPFPSWTYEPSWETSVEKTWQLFKWFRTLDGQPGDEFYSGFWRPGHAFNIANIEAGGSVLYENRRATPQNLAAIAMSVDYPGNPWHWNNNEGYARKLLRRAVIGASVQLCMMWDSGNHDHYRWACYANIGYVFYAAKDFMPPMMRDAMAQGLEQAYYEYLENNHYGLQSTLDQEQRLGVLFWGLAIDDSLRNYGLDTFKAKSEFNFRYEKYSGHSLDHDGGIDLAYQGRTERRALWSYLVGSYFGISQVDHMEDWFNRFAKFRRYQLLPDPDGSYAGPTCRNVGTPTSYYQPQGNITSIFYSLAANFPDFAFNRDRWGKLDFTDQAGMQNLLDGDSQFIHQFNWYIFGNNYDNYSAKDANFGQWGLESTLNNDLMLFEFTKPDEYATISGYSADEATLMYERSHDFIYKAGDAIFGKFNTGTSNEYGVQLYLGDKGFRMNGSSVGEDLDGFTGGWDCLWTKQGGIAAVGVTRGSQTSGNEDLINANVADGYYAGLLGAWAHNHIGMEFANGDVFSTGMMQRLYDSIAYDLNGTQTSADTVENLDSNATSFKAVANGTLKSRNGYDPVTQSITIEETFSADASGFTTDKIITADATAQANNDITQLFETIPICLKPRRASTTGSISIYTNGSWTTPALDQWISAVEAIRLTRNAMNTYWVPDSAVHPNGWNVSFNGQLWQNSSGGLNESIRIMSIDLHGNIGTSKAFPASVRVKYSFNTSFTPAG